MTMLWLVCYDVRDDKRRHKLAKLMEQRCQRVQYSVFECPVSERGLEQSTQSRQITTIYPSIFHTPQQRLSPDTTTSRTTRIRQINTPQPPVDSAAIIKPNPTNRFLNIGFLKQSIRCGKGTASKLHPSHKLPPTTRHLSWMQAISHPIRRLHKISRITHFPTSRFPFRLLKNPINLIRCSLQPHPSD